MNFLKHAPKFLYRECPFGNRHWRWQRLCICGFGYVKDDWHGGIYDLKYKVEMQPCDTCMDLKEETEIYFELEPQLSEEEQVLLDCWRSYRDEILDHYGEVTPYEYRVSVELNGSRETLMTRVQGMAVLGGQKPSVSPENN